jgi:hypothetical protein
MFQVKQSGWNPPTFTVASPNSDPSTSFNSAVFHGPEAKALADEYAAFKNTPASALARKE